MWEKKRRKTKQKKSTNKKTKKNEKKYVPFKVLVNISDYH
jgi:hypothetical protein